MEINDQKTTFSRIKKFLRAKKDKIFKSKIVIFVIVRFIFSIAIVLSSQSM